MALFRWLLFAVPGFLLADQAVTNTSDSGLGSLRNAIDSSTGNETITFSVSGTITLSSELPSITLKPNLIIDGTGQSIIVDGASTYRPFFVNSAGCAIQNLTLQNGRAQGGAGGNSNVSTAGGGAGLGGAVLVTDSGALTLTNVAFSSNSAVGGNGGTTSVGGGSGGSGGGGLGGTGGAALTGSNGGGGGGQLVANTGGAASGLSGGTGTGGGGNGGTGAAGSAGSDWGGGGGGASGSSGGNGGYGGGGGAGTGGLMSTGGTGGYGGGGGGGGGGAGTGGSGGTNGGNGGSGGANSGSGGGGAGLGANIFVRTGGSLTISGCDIPAGTVTAGSAGADASVAGTAGTASGTGFFIQTGTVTLSSSGSNTVSGVIAGGGALSKTGTGSVTLSATNTYTGATTVSAGTLIVTGSISTSSLTTVNAGATLKGTGTVGALTVLGTLQPGTSIGTITVASLTQSSGSTLANEFNATSTSLVNVTGAATIASNTTLQLIPDPAAYVAGTTYTFLTAGSLSGTFDHVTVANGNLGFLTAELLPASNNSLSFVLVNSDAQIAPVSIASSLSIGINRVQMGLITEIQDQRYLLGPICCCRNAPPQEICKKCGKGIKICQEQKTYHPYLVFDYARANISKRTYTTSGIEQFWSGLLGADFYINSWCATGAAIEYIYAKGESSASHQADIDCNNIAASGYFQFNPVGKFYIDGGVIYGYAFYDSHRNNGGDISADFHGFELASQLRFLYQSCYKWLWARPYVAGTYYLDQVNSYHETQSATFGLSIGKDSFDFLDLEAGLYLWAPFRGKYWTWVPQFSFAYVESVLNSPHDVQAGPVSTGIFSSTARFDNVSDHYWKFDGALSFVFGNCAELFFNFSTVVDSAYDAPQNYSAGFELAF